jgi:SAM-dependent methyltransferase
MKRLLIRTYRLVPSALRRSVSRTGPLAWLRQYLERDTALHDEYYTAAYYEEDCSPTRQSAPAMCRAMLGYLEPADVLDVGCGTGLYLEAFRNAGVPCRGVELATAALEQCRAKGLEVARVDLAKGEELPWTADLGHLRFKTHSA